METDVTSLAFTFAKESATQLITISTGLLALGITFTKELLHGVRKGQERGLKAAWGSLVLSIVLGVWSINALTGTLMPIDRGTRLNPLRFEENVRLPALGQNILFVFGVGLLVFVFGSAALTQGPEQYAVFRLGSEDITGRLSDLASDGWEPVTLGLAADGSTLSLMKRRSSRRDPKAKVPL